MSLTPIYDELREHRFTEGAGGAPGARRPVPRLIPAQGGAASVEQLAGRRGLGGRHRRPSG
ncbi:MAG TPA: hypothetical protein VGH99_23740 [Pseudonocardia sp.]